MTLLSGKTILTLQSWGWCNYCLDQQNFTKADGKWVCNQCKNVGLTSRNLSVTNFGGHVTKFFVDEGVAELEKENV